MAENSKIEWTDHTLNLWWGCAKVHTGCKNCYAENLSKRFGDSVWGEKAPRKRIKTSFSNLAKYQRQAEEKNEIHKVFVGSMMDIFEDPKQIQGEDYKGDTGSLRNYLFELIEAGSFPNLVFLFLTKRPENIKKYIPKSWEKKTPQNVWFGTSVSDQETVKYSDLLRYTNLPRLFLSIEPQVGRIGLLNLTGIGWVIQGGESGNKKRPFNFEWAASMQGYCNINKVPYFFKQIDKIQEVPSHLMVRQFPDFTL